MYLLTEGNQNDKSTSPAPQAGRFFSNGVFFLLEEKSISGDQREIASITTPTPIKTGEKIKKTEQIRRIHTLG